MPTQDIAFLSATELGFASKTKEIAPVEAVEAYLDRIERIDPQVNSYITVMAEQARQEALEAEADIRRPDRGTGTSKKGEISWFEINGRFRYQLSLPGRHNAINALAAIAVGRRFGISDEAMNQALGQVDPDAMRFKMSRIGKVDIYNDTYNANPDSVIAALDTFAELKPRRRRRVIALGAMLELGDLC